MDIKKIPFPDQLKSPRRKVVSGFGLWVCVSLIVFSLLLLSNSLNDHIVTPFLMFSNGVSVNASIVSWPFSFSTSYLPYTSSDVYNVSSSKQMFTSQRNVSGVVSERTQLGKNGKNESFRVGEGSVQKRTHEAKSGSERVLEKTHLENASDMVKNVSLHGGDSFFRGNFSIDANRITEVKPVENSTSSFSSEVIKVKNGSVFSPNVGLGGNPRGEEVEEDGDKGMVSLEVCDIFYGRWVKDNSKPYYPAGSCPYIDKDFDCHLNGRPDDGFVKWRWQPNRCDIPSLNATDFLDRLRGKKLVFVGDSLNRNMWESLVCILRQSIRNKKRVYEISGRTEFKKKGFYAFRFEDYNCTVDFVSSPFLVRESAFRGRNGTVETLRLDLMDQTTSMYHDADIIVFNTGHWWTHEKTSRGEDYYQEGNHVYPRLKILKAYKKALLTWAKWIDMNIDSNRTQVLFRGYSVTHFRGGQWNSGGQCHKETEPIYNETYLAKYPSKMRAFQHVLREMKTPVIYLNISRLTDYRKDGHPSIYRMEYKTAEERTAAEQSQDCSHWCLPGVPDTWNELLYASLLKSSK